jgi:hypothetical protein
VGFFFFFFFFTNSISLLVRSVQILLFIHDLVVVGFLVLVSYSFLLGCPFCWHINCSY